MNNAKVIAEQESAIIAENAERMEKAAGIRAAMDRLVDEREEAQELQAKLRVDYSGPLKAADYLRAKSTEELAHVRLETAEKLLRAAERGQVSTDKSLAEVLAPAIGAAVYGAEVIPTFATNAKPTELPCLLLVQAEPTSPRGRSGGFLSGKVELRFVRDAGRAPLDMARVLVALERAHFAGTWPIGASVRTSRTPDGSLVDAVTLDVHKAFEKVPHIAGEPTVDPRTKLLPLNATGRVVSTSVKAGIRTTQVEASVHGRDVDVLRGRAEQLKGSLIIGSGVVTSVGIEAANPGEFGTVFAGQEHIRPAREWTITFSCVSRCSDAAIPAPRKAEGSAEKVSA